LICIDFERSLLTWKGYFLQLVRTVTGKVDDWYVNKHESLDDVLGVDTKYHHRLQDGSQCCSTRTVSFHYVEAGESLVFWDVLQKVHQSLLSDVEIKELMNKVWPRDIEGLGRFAHGLPPISQLAVWDDITKVVRKVSFGMTPPSC
jgi:hypothetical protein